MKIASVTFFPYAFQAGGAQTGAITFKEWTNLIEGHSAQTIGIIMGVKRVVRLAKGIDKVISEKCISGLNEYDMIFFNTPPMKEINLSGIEKPIFMMLHGESEFAMYGGENIKRIVSHRMFKGILAVAHDETVSRLHKTFLTWYPIISPSIFYQPFKINRKPGMLCASRITRHKNILLFNKLANEMLPFTEVRPRLQGVCQNQKYEQLVKECLGSVNFTNHKFDSLIYEIEEFNTIWSYMGTIQHQIKMPRLETVTIEALMKGLMPIVRRSAIPKEFQGWFIEYEIDMSIGTFARVLEKYYEEMPERVPKLISKLTHGSSYGIEKLSENFKILLERMINEI